MRSEQDKETNREEIDESRRNNDYMGVRPIVVRISSDLQKFRAIVPVLK